MVEAALVTRAGSVRQLFPRETRTTQGRLIECPGCGAHVDIIEIQLTAGATGSSMRPDVCGECQPIAHRLEPVVELEQRPDPGRPLVGRRHRDATDTELASSRRNTPARGSQREAVLERLREVGEHGSTDFELYDHGIGVRPHVPATRREELIADGWPIVDSGERRRTDTGAPAIVWRLEAES